MSDLWNFNLVYEGQLVPFLQQFVEAYASSKTMNAIFALFGAGLLVLVLAPSKEEPESDEKTFVLVRKRTWRKRVAPLLAIFGALPLLIVDFADNVYPNVKYNLGGGQPRLAEIELLNASEYVSRTLRASPCKNSPVETSCIAHSEAAVIWHQSDKFVYVTGIGDVVEGGGTLLAIDANMVQGMKFLRKYVRISAGSQIVAVGPDDTTTPRE